MPPATLTRLSIALFPAGCCTLSWQPLGATTPPVMQGTASKDNPDGLTPAQRKERDAKALQEKTAKKAAAAAAANK